jgi:predicted GNAT family N-acyltransferase
MSAPGTEGDSIQIVEAPYGSDLYRRALVLRDTILRAPLGLAVTPQEQADDAHRQHFCALSGGVVVGSVSFEPLDAKTAQLRQMAVTADRRRQGIGARLLTCGEAWARDSGYRLIVLHARLGADGFYARFGYRTQGEPFDEHTVPHILTTKRIVPRPEPA